MSRPLTESYITEARLARTMFRTSNLERRPPLPATEVVAAVQYEIKIFRDSGTTDSILTTGDGKFIWAIPRDIDGYVLIEAEAYITTVSSSGVVTIQVHNINEAVDMLSTRITIDVGDFTSYAATTPSVINTANDGVSMADRLRIDVDVAGTGARGLGVILTFGPDVVP